MSNITKLPAFGDMLNAGIQTIKKFEYAEYRWSHGIL